MEPHYRRAWNVPKYVRKMIHRLDLDNGRVVIEVHFYQGNVAKVTLCAEVAFSIGPAGDVRREFHRDDGLTPARSLRELVEVIKGRLHRLFRGSSLRFGTLRIELLDGEIVWIIPSRLTR